MWRLIHAKEVVRESYDNIFKVQNELMIDKAKVRECYDDVTDIVKEMKANRIYGWQLLEIGLRSAFRKIIEIE